MTDRRLSRVPMRVQWMATIDLAIALAEGRAAWTQDRITATHEERWWWPSSTIPVYAASRPQDPSAYSGYWYVSSRIARRARALVESATWAALDRAAACRLIARRICLLCGDCDACAPARQEDTVCFLRRWKRSGRWQRRVSPSLARRDDVLTERAASVLQTHDDYTASATPQWGSVRTPETTTCSREATP